MEWINNTIKEIEPENIENKEQKEKIAKIVAGKVKNGDVIGFGSGSTSYLAIKEIAKKIEEENLHIIAIPTSYEVKVLCQQYKIPTASILECKPDWGFDGADEVDKNNNWIIKGRGAAMFKEKLNIVNAGITYILVDDTKLVENLGEKSPIPIEVYPEAVNSVKEALLDLGATECMVRKAEKKDGPVFTENNNVILDTKFAEIYETLEDDIKAITGVIESICCNYQPVIFYLSPLPVMLLCLTSGSPRNLFIKANDLFPVSSKM